MQAASLLFVAALVVVAAAEPFGCYDPASKSGLPSCFVDNAAHCRINGLQIYAGGGATGFCGNVPASRFFCEETGVEFSLTPTPSESETTSAVPTPFGVARC